MRGGDLQSTEGLSCLKKRVATVGIECRVGMTWLRRGLKELTEHFHNWQAMRIHSVSLLSLRKQAFAEASFRDCTLQSGGPVENRFVRERELDPIR
jgi:hypothetical protein